MPERWSFDRIIDKALLTAIVAMMGVGAKGSDQVVAELASIRVAIADTATVLKANSEELRAHAKRLDSLELAKHRR